MRGRASACSLAGINWFFIFDRAALEREFALLEGGSKTTRASSHAARRVL